MTAEQIEAYIHKHGVKAASETIAANLRYYSGSVHTDSTCSPECAANQFCDAGKCYDRLEPV